MIDCKRLHGQSCWTGHLLLVTQRAGVLILREEKLAIYINAKVMLLSLGCKYLWRVMDQHTQCFIYHCKHNSDHISPS